MMTTAENSDAFQLRPGTVVASLTSGKQFVNSDPFLVKIHKLVMIVDTKNSC
jgi:hypothetical protein